MVDGFTTHQVISADSVDEANAFNNSPVEPMIQLSYLVRVLAVTSVSYLHKKSVRHKDLKPANTLLCPDGFRLTDFGTATDLIDLNLSRIDNSASWYLSILLQDMLFVERLVLSELRRIQAVHNVNLSHGSCLAES